MQEGRLNRQWAVPGITNEERDRLCRANVLVIGAGGLGHPVVAYLAGSGVASITVIDHDVVEVSNLSRQFYFGYQDVGQLKVNCLAAAININVGCDLIKAQAERVELEEVQDRIQGYDLVLECSDDLSLKYAFSRACKQFNIPLIIGSVDQWQGQVLVVPDGEAAGYDDFFPIQENVCSWGSCASNGVIGSVVGVMGTLMANEAIKMLLGKPIIRKNRIIIFDGLISELIYISRAKLYVHDNQRIERPFDQSLMKSISYAEMQKWKEEGKNFQLIDVREQDEFDEFNIGGHLLPMNTVPDHVEAFSREIPVVVHCKAGSRSATVIRFLEEQYGFGNLYNLEGGVLAVR